MITMFWAVSTILTRISVAIVSEKTGNILIDKLLIAASHLFAEKYSWQRNRDNLRRTFCFGEIRIPPSSWILSML